MNSVLFFQINKQKQVFGCDRKAGGGQEKRLQNINNDRCMKTVFDKNDTSHLIIISYCFNNIYADMLVNILHVFLHLETE